ncbi:MAG: S9 family peptidase [Vicinamibacterales bacterium]
MLTPPVAPRRPRETTVHGHRLIDDYFWMRERDSSEVQAWLRTEEAYAEAVMAPTAPLQAALYDELLGHIKQADSSAPYRRGDFFYYTRIEEGAQYSVHYRRRGRLDAPEQVILDQPALAHGHPFFSVGAMAVSDDGRLLAYTTDVTGYRQYTLRVKDLETGALLGITVERVTDVTWAADGRTLFYVVEDPVTKRACQLRRHRLDEPDSTLVFEETDEVFDLAVGRTRDRAVIVMQSASKTSTECHWIDARRPEDPLRLILAREPRHEYDVDHRAGRFYFRTNRGATNFRVTSAPVATPAPEHWTEVAPHRATVKVAGMDLFAGHLVLSLWEDGLPAIEVRDLVRGETHRIPAPEPVYSIGTGPNAEFETTTVRYHYQSLVTPPSVYDYDMRTREAVLVKRVEVPGGFDPARYVTTRAWATAGDGTRVPVSLVSRADVPRDGSAPMLLGAYGSYGISVAPAFSSNRLALLDRGVVIGLAHVRGGGELGEPWREQGRMMKKLNTFTDFIACAEHLVATRVTSADRLIIQGGSAGGLLVAAVTNMRPDLFKAVVGHVPFVDVLNTMLDPSLPLTTVEYVEWGDPREREAFDYIRQYSPYENVRAQAYPAMLLKVSVHDSQVPYWEGAKLAARLRALKTNDAPVLLKVNFGAGHGGASGRFDALREVAFDYAFILWQAGLAGCATDPTVVK